MGHNLLAPLQVSRYVICYTFGHVFRFLLGTLQPKCRLMGGCPNGFQTGRSVRRSNAARAPSRETSRCLIGARKYVHDDASRGCSGVPSVYARLASASSRARTARSFRQLYLLGESRASGDQALCCLVALFASFVALCIRYGHHSNLATPLIRWAGRPLTAGRGGAW